MIFLFILCTTFLRGNVLAGPLPLSHPPSEISFSPREIDSNRFIQRSEWNIIWSCFATLFACSWVAIHPNIPDPSDSSMRIFSRRLMMMVYMLIAPEMMMIWAARQWYAAHDIAERYRHREWTKTHGFFASMGGFMLYKDGVMNKPLGTETLDQLASEGKIDWPSISEKDIQDRSKGDYFTKGFVVLQTTWFITQCIARGVAGLIITELELATLAFSILNGILYFLWWNKPQDVPCPIAVHLRGPNTSDTARPSSEQETRMETMCSEPRETPPLSPMKESESLPSQLLSPTPSQHPPAFARFRTYFSRKFKDMGLFALLDAFILKPFAIIWSPVNCSAIDDGPTLSVPTFYAPITLREERAIYIGIGVGALFGGIHCIAWPFSFPSVAEQHIWRISAVTITATPIAFAASTALVLFLESIDPRSRHFPFGLSFGQLVVFGKLVESFASLGYVVSRTALLILPLLALRSLSPESLLDVNWSVYIPHV